MFSSRQKHERFTVVVEHYGPILLRFVTRMLGETSEAAEDLVQDSFLKLAAHWKGDFAPSPAMTKWLQSTAHHLVIDYLRKTKRREQLHEHHAAVHADAVVQPSPGQGAEDLSEGAARAAEALDCLTERERLLVTLKVYEELSYKEISGRTGLSVGNVGFLLHGAMKKLASYLSSHPSAGDPRHG